MHEVLQKERPAAAVREVRRTVQPDPISPFFFASPTEGTSLLTHLSLSNVSSKDTELSVTVLLTPPIGLVAILNAALVDQPRALRFSRDVMEGRGASPGSAAGCKSGLTVHGRPDWSAHNGHDARIFGSQP